MRRFLSKINKNNLSVFDNFLSTYSEDFQINEANKRISQSSKYCCFSKRDPENTYKKNSALVSISWGHKDDDGLSLSAGSDGAALMLVTRWRVGASRSDDVGKWSWLAWIPPALKTRELGQPSLCIKIHLKVK